MISFAYFDLGGVVIKDFSGTNKWAEMKGVMGVTKDMEEEFDELYDQYELKELCLTRDVDSLMPIFKKKFGLKFPKDFSMLEYFIKHFEQNTSIWPIIKEVQKNRGIGLLTNMYPRMLDAIRKQNLLPPVEWNVIIDSSVERVQKPDQKIFKLAQEKAGVKGEEVLFIDNTEINTDAAATYGWQTFLYDPTDHEVACRKLENMLFGKYFRKLPHKQVN